MHYRNGREAKNGRHGTILGANGAPSKINLSVQYSPGPLAYPVVLPPINAEGGFLAPAFGGATRMETIAARLLAGVLTPASFCECARDTADRRQLIHAATVIAWELICYAGEFRGFPPEGAPPEECEPGPQQEPPEPEKPSAIVGS